MTLPNFFVAGTVRSATTTHYQYLRYHPDVFVTKIKEPRFLMFEPDNPDHATASQCRLPIRTLDKSAGRQAMIDATRRLVARNQPDCFIPRTLRTHLHKRFVRFSNSNLTEASALPGELRAQLT